MDSGRVLLAQNAHTPLPPGSLTKVLTASIAAAWLKPSSLVPVTPVAANVAPDKLGMKAGQMWPLGIVLHALLISSSNDAAYALAERVSGTLDRFMTVMKEAAAQERWPDSAVLRDPAGLDGTEGHRGGNLVSAWDLAVAARDMMANPFLARIVAMKSYEFTGPDRIVYIILSHNRAFLNSYPGAIGVKTGFTDRAGVCVIEEAQRGNRRMMAVVLDGVSPDETAGLLLDRGFATPLRAESMRAPTLPAVVIPEPPLTALPPRLVDHEPAGELVQVHGKAAVPGGGPGLTAASSSSLASTYGLDAAGGAGIIVGLALIGRRLKRRMRAPVGAHSGPRSARLAPPDVDTDVADAAADA